MSLGWAQKTYNSVLFLLSVSIAPLIHAQDCSRAAPAQVINIDSIQWEEKFLASELMFTWPGSEDDKSQGPAKILLNISGDSLNGWALQFEYNFDGAELGIPYALDATQIQWETSQGRSSRLLEWGDGCAGSGRSLFPGQRVRGEFLFHSRDAQSLKEIEFQFWYSRN